MDLSCRLLWILDMQILHSLLPSHHFCISIHLSRPSNHLATFSSLSFNHFCLCFALSVPSSHAILDFFFFLNQNLHKTVLSLSKIAILTKTVSYWEICMQDVWFSARGTLVLLFPSYVVFTLLFIYILRQKEFWIDARHLPRNFIFWGGLPETYWQGFLQVTFASSECLARALFKETVCA